MINKYLKIIAAVVLACVATTAHAQSTGSFVVSDFINAAATWGGTILASAFALFWLLAAIDFIWMGIVLALKQADLGEVVAEFVHRVMHIGFFLALLSMASSWAPTIIASLTTLATNASGAPAPTIGNVMASAMTICGAIFDAMTIWDPGTSILLALMCVVVLILFALIAAEIAVSLVSVWIIIYAGMIMLGFGGSRWTQDYAISYYRAVLAASVKLYIMQMLLGIGMTVITKITAKTSGLAGANIVDFFAIAAACLILYILIMRIGELTQALMSGSVMASSNALAVGAAAAATVATAAVGGATAVNSASQLASAQSEANGGSGLAKTLGEAGESVGGALGGEKGAAALGSVGRTLGGALQHAASTVANLGGAAKDDYMDGVKGNPGSTMGTKGGRMASRLEDELASIKGQESTQDESKNFVFGVEQEANSVNTESTNKPASVTPITPTEPTGNNTPDKDPL